MTSKDEVRLDIENRVQVKKSLRGASSVVMDINQAIAKYPDLSTRERDFAFRYALEHRTYPGWANYYGCAVVTIQRMMSNPRVRNLISEIQFDMRKYMVGMQLFLMRESMEQYLRILRAPENLPNVLEVKRKVADKIVDWFGRGDRPKEPTTPGVNVNFNFGEGGTDVPESRVVSPNMEGETRRLTVTEVELELTKFKQLDGLRQQVEKYAPQRIIGEKQVIVEEVE
jgi:hypothetical protein